MREHLWKILLIESNRLQAQLLGKIIRDEYPESTHDHLVISHSLSEGIEQLNSGSFDIIFISLSLNDCDAAETVTRIKPECHSTPFIVLTGSEDKEHAIRSLKQGAQDYLVKKEITEKVLSKSILYAIERKKMEKALKKAKDEAEAANKAKSRFLANLTHDIRTPLGAIIGFNEILTNKADELSLPEEFLTFQKNIQSAAQNLLEMINNFLDISKIEAGKMDVIEEDFNINDLIKTIFVTHEILAQQKEVKFSYSIASDIPPLLRMDRTKLNQILTNLIGNAIKFTPAGKKVELCVVKEKESIVFTVKDQGIGIPKDRQNAIFGAFEQAEDSTSKKFGGTGLGLAITKKLTKMLKGTVKLESEGDGKGSAFHIYLPCNALATPVTNQKAASDVKIRLNKNSIILVVEDNPMNQALIRAIFKSVGFKVRFANNGQQGVEKTMQMVRQGTPPDLILMDMQMPIMNGIEATIEIRKHPDNKDIPIIALSADAFLEHQKDALAAGMNDYLTKPIERAKLKEMLLKYLKRSMSQD